jgi:tetratricopeptide (TPR) repeat protein
VKPAPRAAMLLVIALAWGFQAAERTRDWRSFETLVDADFRAFPGFSMPAMYKSDIQISKGLFREAVDTANRIAIPEVRSSMIKLVKAHQAVIESSSLGNAHEAIDILLDFGLDLKQAPIQAQWNAPIGIIWKVNRNYLGFEWQNLSKRFPNDVSVPYNAGLALLAIQEYEGAITHLLAAIRSEQLPESMRGTAYKSLGLALMKAGRAIQAEAPLRAALEQSPPDLQAYCALSEVYKQTKRFDDAERAAAGCSGGVSK